MQVARTNTTRDLIQCFNNSTKYFSLLTNWKICNVIFRRMRTQDATMCFKYFKSNIPTTLSVRICWPLILFCFDRSNMLQCDRSFGFLTWYNLGLHWSKCLRLLWVCFSPCEKFTHPLKLVFAQHELRQVKNNCIVRHLARVNFSLFLFLHHLTPGYNKTCGINFISNQATLLNLPHIPDCICFQRLRDDGGNNRITIFLTLNFFPSWWLTIWFSQNQKDWVPISSYQSVLAHEVFIKSDLLAKELSKTFFYVWKGKRFRKLPTYVLFPSFTFGTVRCSFGSTFSESWNFLFSEFCS